MSEQRPAYLYRFCNRRSIDDLAHLSRDGNGRVREEALRRLAALADTATLPALLERVNDWVAPIRDRARRSVLDLATTANAAAFVQQLPEIDRLREALRQVLDEHPAVVQALRRQAGVAFALASSGLPLPPCVSDAADGAATGPAAARASFWQRLRRSWSAL